MTGKAFIKGCPGYKENPTDNDTIHCVVLFFNAETFSVMPENLKMKIKDIRKEADSRRKQNLSFPVIFIKSPHIRSLPLGGSHQD